MTLNGTHKITMAMVQASVQMDQESSQTHEENSNAMQNLRDTVKSVFVKLSVQKEALQKEVIALKAQLIAKEAAHEAARKSMQELIGTMRKEMEILYKRIDDLEHVAKEHFHDSRGKPMIQIGTRFVPDLIPIMSPIKFPLKASARRNYSEC